MVACYNGPLEAGEEVLRPLREFGTPLEDHLQPMPYTQIQKMFDEAWGIGRQYYVKAPWVKEISGDAIDILMAHFAKVTSPLSLAVFFQRGRHAARGPHIRLLSATGCEVFCLTYYPPCGSIPRNRRGISVGRAGYRRR